MYYYDPSYNLNYWVVHCWNDKGSVSVGSHEVVAARASRRAQSGHLRILENLEILHQDIVNSRPSQDFHRIFMKFSWKNSSSAYLQRIRGISPTVISSFWEARETCRMAKRMNLGSWIFLMILKKPGVDDPVWCRGQGKWMKIPTSCEKISEGIEAFTGENHYRIPRFSKLAHGAWPWKLRVLRSTLRE